MAAMSDRWTEAQRTHYGRIYRFLISSVPAVTHPQAKPMPDEHWETICHNAAWIAAEMLEPGEIEIRDTDTGEFVASTKQALH